VIESMILGGAAEERHTIIDDLKPWLRGKVSSSGRRPSLPKRSGMPLTLGRLDPLHR